MPQSQSRRRFIWVVSGFLLAALIISVFIYRSYSGQSAFWFAFAFVLGASLALVLARLQRPWIWLLAVLAVAPPAYLFYLSNTGYTGGGSHWWNRSFPRVGLTITVFGGIIFFGYVAYIWLLKRRESGFQHLFGEIKFVAFQTHYLWVLAGAIGCVLAGLRLLVPVDPHHLYERYESIVGTYIAVFVALVGIKLLYRETAPIVEVDHLLQMLIDDLTNPDVDKLWVVYPALNIGYYRHHFRLGSVSDDDLCEKYKRAQKRAAGRLGNKAHAVTYPKDLYRKLYDCYDGMVAGLDINEERVKHCVSDALDFVNDFTEQEPTARGQLHEIPPHEFPPHVIVIGKITYMIMSYGLPLYNAQNQSFRAIGGGTGVEKLADLLVYRRDDPETADVISKHLQDLVGGGTTTGPALPPSPPTAAPTPTPMVTQTPAPTPTPT